MLAVIVPVLGLTDQALAEDDDEDDDALIVFDADWRAELPITPDAQVDNVFYAMTRVDGPDAPCDPQSGTPLLARPEPAPQSWACTRIVNVSDRAGAWRIDFEGTFGAGYKLDLVQYDTRTTIFYNPGPGVLDATPVLTMGRWLASHPIVIPAGESALLYARVETPSDLQDADPVLLPEERFDEKLFNRGLVFAILVGSSILLLSFFTAFAQLLQSVPARRYALYFGAATLAAISNEGYLNVVAPANPIVVMGVLDKALEAAQVTAHLLFVSAFVASGVPDSPWPRWLRRGAWVAGLGLVAAAVLSALIGGIQGAIRYHDLGFELDPLIDNPFNSPALLLAALVNGMWYLSVLLAAGYTVIRRAIGGRLFALGALVLVFGMLFAGFSEELTGNLGDDQLLPQYVLLADALLFAAAMVWQVFGIRNERDSAIRQELETTREKMRLAESLLQSRKDLDRTRALAEAHRERLALTGHDLRQPLTSLHLALAELDTSNPELGQTLRSNVEYLRAVLDETVAATRPTGLSEDEGGYHTQVPDRETVPTDVLMSNAVRMFGEEARRKGLALSFEPSSHEVLCQPVALIRILSNLVSNAVKYTAEGSVTLRSVEVDGRIDIEIEDTGPGLSPEEIATIRQSYQRGAGSENVPGDGLGLPGAEAFARSIGLRIEIRSTPGQGSVFVIAGMEPA